MARGRRRMLARQRDIQDAQEAPRSTAEADGTRAVRQ